MYKVLVMMNIVLLKVTYVTVSLLACPRNIFEWTYASVLVFNKTCVVCCVHAQSLVHCMWYSPDSELVGLYQKYI